MFSFNKNRSFYTTLLLSVLMLSSTAALANETIVYNIEAGSDDAEEGDNGPGVMDITSTDLELTYDHSDPTRAQTIGLRFKHIDIPKGTRIAEAYIQFTTDEDDKNRNPFNINIWAEASDDAAGYVAEDYNISNREKTSSSTLWSGTPEWTVKHEAGLGQRTANVATLIQEVVDREGWQKGNAISFIMQGQGTRTAESFEGSQSHISVADYAPQLIIVLPSTQSYTISNSSDDAEEYDNAGNIDTGSSDIELVEDRKNAPQKVGLRFTNVTVPAGAEILNASIQFAVDEPNKNRNPFNLNIYGQAADSPSTFINTKHNISQRDKTQAAVNWKDIPNWAVTHAAGDKQRTPDLTSIVKEIVERKGWQEGNAMTFIIEGQGTRTAESFDGSSELAPRLDITFIGESNNAVKVADKIRLSWNDDPATTMDVIWDQIDKKQTKIYYDYYSAEQGCSTDINDYEYSAAPVRSRVYRTMNNQIATLQNLTPDSAYRFVIANDQGMSECSWFRTAPNIEKAFTYIVGGDTKSSGNALQAGRWSNEMVAKLRPLFVFFTGDFNSGDGTNSARWVQWLTDWSTLTRSEDGRVYPIIPVHGNHEDGDMEVLYELFNSGNNDQGQDSHYSYESLSFGGSLLKLIKLNSQLYLNGLNADHEQQTLWLEQELASSTDYSFTVAGYHKPIRPHTKSKAENDFLIPWAKLFDQYRLSVAYEGDSHMHKFTYPLRASEEEGNDMGFVRDDENGTLYVGEGSWGATPRANNDDKSWTIDSAAMNQIKWAKVTPKTASSAARLDMRTVVTASYENGNLVNYVDQVAAITEDNVFDVPDGMNMHNTPFYGTVMTLPFVPVQGDVPSAPYSLNGKGTSYTETTIDWMFSGEISQTRTIELQRKLGLDGTWKSIANLAPSETNYHDKDLSSGTEYYYRVRATNIFGESPWSDDIMVATLIDNRQKVQFQVGLNEYTDSHTVIIASASPDTNFIGPVISIDGSTSDYGSPSGQGQGLVYFGGIFDGSIPNGATIESAELRFWTENSSSGPVGVYQIYQPWNVQDVTWNSMANGVTTDGNQANATPDQSYTDIHYNQLLKFDVTSTVKSWQQGQSNNGWAIINLGGDGWDIDTELYDGFAPYEQRRPMLTIFYNIKGDIDGNGTVDRADISTLRQYLRSSPESCQACDLNQDGQISMADLRALMLIIRNQAQ